MPKTVAFLGGVCHTESINLPSERMISMKLTILGMNGPFPAPGGACSGYLLQTESAAIQLDCGCGVLPSLLNITPVSSLTALVLSHWHNDHCSDVLSMIYLTESHLAAHPDQPLHVYGPVDEASPVRKAVQTTPGMVLHDVAPGDVLTLGDVQLTAYPARHPVPAVMYRITDGQHTLCYTGDTNTQAILPDYARNADLLLADGLFAEATWAEGKPHLSAALCAQLAKEANVGKLIVTHLNPQTDHSVLLHEAQAIFPDVVLAERGMTCQL